MKIISNKISKNEISQWVSDTITEIDRPIDILSSWNNSFSIKKENQETNEKGLRNPQIGALYAILSHWSYSNEIGTIVMPTGTGKTETMLSILVSEKIKQLLVVVPTSPLRTQISNKFLKLGLLNELEIIPDNIKYPIVGTIKSSFDSQQNARQFFQKCNVIVATASILSRMDSQMLDELKNTCTHLFIDEAHHTEASTWNKIRNNFKGKKIIQFTATPFRNDNKKIDGKIIYNFPLKKAQEEGYFKPINFVSIYEYSTSQKDIAIAEKGIEQLRIDKERFPHILLARVGTKKRAEEVYEIYKKYEEFRVVRIHSGLGVREKREIYNQITEKNVDIIVCVDMLGEGFDLPQLKIATFHDIRKSLPITLQFVGRFTRTQHDRELGNATIIANLADLEVSNELEELYAKDPDWNILLPLMSENRTQKEVDLYNFVQGFQYNEDFPISVQSLKPALSTVVYRNNSDAWFPSNFIKGLSSVDSYDLIRHNLNSEEKILVILTAKKIQTDWINNDNITDLIWNYYIVYWETRKNLLFIHSSDNSSLHLDIAKSIIGEDAEIINGDNGGKIFRILSGIHRFKLQNVGLTEVIGKLIRFVMRVGSDIEPALSRNDTQRAKKAMIFGAGYENGAEISIGCSYKGRIWSRRKNDIPTLIKWFNHIGNKVTDENIDANEVLKDALVAKSINERPVLFPFYIDWSVDIYKQSETRYSFIIGNTEYELYNIDIVLINPSESGNICFGLKYNERIIVKLELEIFINGNHSDFRFIKTNPEEAVSVKYGTKRKLIEDYFYEDTPVIWFSNGDYLEGNNHIELKGLSNPYNADEIIAWNWTGVDLRHESQGIEPKKEDSIQFNFIKHLNTLDYDIIFDDDGSGEISDIITIKSGTDKIKVELYHLKYAVDGRVSRQIKNLYEVCGQAQKSVNWNFKRGKEFLEHLLRREALRENKGQSSRFDKGTKDELVNILDLVNNRVLLEFEIYIVQPGLSKSNNTEQQLTLLGVTETYLMERALIKLKVIGSE